MPMNIKKDQRAPTRWKKFLLSCFKKMLFLVIFVCILGAIGWAAYHYMEPVRETFDQIADFIDPIVQEHGWLPVIAGCLLILGAAWAIVEEQSEKERKRQKERERAW